MKVKNLLWVIIVTLTLTMGVMAQDLKNYVEDPGFEWGTAFVEDTTFYAAGGPPGWTGWINKAFLDDLFPHTGAWSGAIAEIPVEGDYDDGGFGQVVEGLKPGENYLMTAFGRLDWFTGTTNEWGLYIGVQAFGRPKVQTTIFDPEYVPVILKFTMGDTNTWADVWGWRGPGGEATMDDFGVWDYHNFLANGDFETGDLSGWDAWQYNVAIETVDTLAGNYSVRIDGVDWGGGCAQIVKDLKPGATYGLQASLKVATEGDTVYFGVKNYGADELQFHVGNTAYTQGTLSFTMPEGNTEAEIYVWKDHAGVAFCDNYLMCLMIEPTETAVEAAKNISSVSKSYVLEQNYPNPFNPRTVIRFALPCSELIKLIVYDLTGSEVKTLTHRTFSQGIHAVEWDGTDQQGNVVPTGIYFYKLEAGTYPQVRKLTFIK